MVVCSKVFPGGNDCCLFANFTFGSSESMLQSGAGIPLCQQYPLFIASANAANIIYNCSKCGGIRTVVTPG
eukprot:194290-Karenia_brevis.AAC.1